MIKGNKRHGKNGGMENFFNGGCSLMGGYFLNEGCLRTMLIENLKEKKQLRKCIYSLQTNITK